MVVLDYGTQGPTSKIRVVTLLCIQQINHRLTGKLTGHLMEISNALFNVDHTQIITASLDTTAKLWDVRNLHCVHTFCGHTDEVLFKSLIFLVLSKQFLGAGRST